MQKSKSEDHLDRNLRETFGNLTIPHSSLNGHLAILKKYTTNGNYSGFNEPKNKFTKTL